MITKIDVCKVYFFVEDQGEQFCIQYNGSHRELVFLFANALISQPGLSAAIREAMEMVLFKSTGIVVGEVRDQLDEVMRNAIKRKQN